MTYLMTRGDKICKAMKTLENAYEALHLVDKQICARKVTDIELLPIIEMKIKIGVIYEKLNNQLRYC